ncbi:NipSnap-like protein 3A [Oryzias melastigma]|uniref:NipSnap-like protein 3A n=1 Tax=Oryzias melastigma TaxID=30732 RepID=A0A834FC83_ORYME|nr:NipSnap-like protein 3A [Oryzias melastigma]
MSKLGVFLRSAALLRPAASTSQVSPPGQTSTVSRTGPRSWSNINQQLRSPAGVVDPELDTASRGPVCLRDVRAHVDARVPVTLVHVSTLAPSRSIKPSTSFAPTASTPIMNAAFLKLTNEKIHLRTAHSELIGYWSVEYGGLNQVFHIWKYAMMLTAPPPPLRQLLRASSCAGRSGPGPHLDFRVLSLRRSRCLTSQDNEVTYLVPWSRLQKPPKEGGVYELASYRMRPGGPAVWGSAFQAAVCARDAPGYGKLLGAFHSEFGAQNQVHALWWYESADHRAEVRHKAHNDARVVAAGETPPPPRHSALFGRM